MSSPPTYPPSLEHLPEVNFAVKDSALVEAEMVRDYETRFLELTKIPKTLAPADPMRLALLTVADQVSHLRTLIDFAGKENLLKYTHEEYLDGVASLYGPRADRLPPYKAKTVLRFTLTTVLSFDALIPFNTKVSGANNVVFGTTVAGIIRAGDRTIDLPAEASEPGPQANDYLPGQISTLVEWNQAWGVNATNIVKTGDGSDIEDDFRMRYRTWLTPESFSISGPVEAYEYWMLRAHPDIIQARVYSAPAIAGEVHLYPLMRGGELPSDEVLGLVLASAAASSKRPVTDYVSAFRAELFIYKVRIDFYIREQDESLGASIIAAVRQAIREYILWQRSYIGRDLNPNEMVRLVKNAGAKRIDEATMEPPLYERLAYNQLAVLDEDDEPEINFIDYEDE